MWQPSSRTTVVVKQEQRQSDDEAEDSDNTGKERSKKIHLVISMDIKLEPVVKKEHPSDGELDDSRDTLPIPSDELLQNREDNDVDRKDIKFNVKTEEKDEASDSSATEVDQDERIIDGHESDCCPPRVRDQSCVVNRPSSVRMEGSDLDSDSDDDEDFLVKVKDVLREEDVDQMLARCQQILDLQSRPADLPDPETKYKSLTWPVDQVRREKRINSISIFTDSRLNEFIRKVLLLPDSLTSMTRAVQYLTFVFWERKKLSSCYLPDMLTALPEILYGQMPLRGFKLFFAIFMHILRIPSPAKFEANPIIDAIVADVNHWDTWFLFKSGKKRHKDCREKEQKARKARKRVTKADEELEQEELDVIIDRCRKRLHRQPSHIDSDGEIQWPRIYDLDGSLSEAADVFTDRKLHYLIKKLLLTEKSKSSLSGAVDNMGRVLWSRQEIRNQQFPSPKDLLNPKHDWDQQKESAFLKRSIRLYEMFMRIQGRYRNVREFAASRWADDVYRAFRMKFV